MIEDIMVYASKVAFLLLILVGIEALFTRGSAFELVNYNFAGYLAQFCVLVLIFRAAMLKWID